MKKILLYSLPGLVLFSLLSVGVIAVSADSPQKEKSVNRFNNNGCWFENLDESQKEDFLAKKEQINFFREELKNLSSEERQAKMESFREGIKEWKENNEMDSNFGPMKNFQRGQMRNFREAKFKNSSSAIE